MVESVQVLWQRGCCLWRSVRGQPQHEPGGSPKRPLNQKEGEEEHETFEPSKEPEEKKAKGSAGSRQGAVQDDLVLWQGSLSPGCRGRLHKGPGTPKLTDGPDLDLDFSVLQRSQQLNVDVTKQRINLRQKGSLAKRRRPTRSSMRSRSSSDGDMFEDSTEPRRTARRGASGDDEDEDEDEDEERAFRGRLGPSNLEGKVAPVLLPGLSQTARPLRKAKPPVPLPKTRHTSGPSPSDKPRGPVAPPGESGGVPPWMSDMKARRTPRSAQRASSEVSKERAGTETPPWLRDVLAKKKRTVENLDRRAPQQAAEPDEPAGAPWMKERALRKSNRPSLHNTLQKDYANNKNASGQSSPRDEDPHNKSSSTLIIDFDSPKPAWLSMSESMRTRGREVLAPIKRSGSAVINNVVYSEGRDENTPPLGGSTGYVNPLAENTSSQKSSLPPLRSSPSLCHTGQENAESPPVPAWRIEIAARRKSRTFVPAHKPETPLRLGETPTWKRELAERNKVKKRDSIEGSSTNGLVTDASLPPWKQELVQRRRRPPSISKDSGLIKTTPDGSTR